jgi:hypothetical protein
MLVFGFQHPHNFLKPAVAVRGTGCLTLGIPAPPGRARRQHRSPQRRPRRCGPASTIVPICQPPSRRKFRDVDPRGRSERYLAPAPQDRAARRPGGAPGRAEGYSEMVSATGRTAADLTRTDRHRLQRPCHLDHQAAHTDHPIVNLGLIEPGNLFGQCFHGKPCRESPDEHRGAVSRRVN